jgi:galactonate dehydratase
MHVVAQNTKIPIATGERLTTKYEFFDILQAGAASILQPALGRVGGIWEAKKIAAIAEVFGAQIAPHLYAGPIEWAANIQLSITLPNFLLLETIGIGDGFHDDLLTSKIIWEEGYVFPPSAPGLGVELNEVLARKHEYTGNDLHLNMAQTEPM